MKRNNIYRSLKQKFLIWYKSLTYEKQTMVRTAAKIFAVVFIFMLLWTASSKASTYNAINHASRSFFYYIFFNFSAYPMALFLSCGFVMIYFLIFYKGNDIRNEVKEQYEEKNVEVMTKKVGGSAEEMAIKRVEQAFTVATIDDLNNIVRQTSIPHEDDPMEYLNNPLAAPVFGSLLDRYDPQRRLVFFKPNKYQTISSALLNILVLGQSGSGKSFTVSRNMHFQAAMRGESVFINDPSGELYADGAVLGKNRGASVKMLNLIDLARSDSWNCIQECINETTGRVSSKQVGMFATVFVMNAEGGEEEEVFWKKQCIGYIKAAIAYVAFLHEDAIMTSYKQIFDTITKGVPNCEKISSRFKDQTPLTWCENMIMKAAVSTGCDLNDVYEAMENAKKIAPKFTLAEVVEVLSEDKNMEKMDTFYTTGNCPKKYFGKRAYTSVKRKDTPASIVESAMTTLRGKLSLFDDEMLLYNLSHDGISTTDFNKKQCLYYLSMDTQETTLKPIASLFTTFLLRNAQLTYNAAQRIADETGEPNPCRPITCILDEAPSLGLIGGTQDWFPLFLSNSRKAGCKTIIMSQTVGMLQAIYGEYQWQTIQSNCEINMVLGVNDDGTAKYVTDFLGGDATYVAESHKMIIGVTNRSANEITIHPQSGKLYDTSYTRRMQEVILLVKHGEQPIELEPFAYVKHPMAKEIVKKTVRSSIPSYYFKVHEELTLAKYTSAINFSEELSSIHQEGTSYAEIDRLSKFFNSVEYVDPQREYIKYDPETGELILYDENLDTEYDQYHLEETIDADVLAEIELKQRVKELKAELDAKKQKQTSLVKIDEANKNAGISDEDSEEENETYTVFNVISNPEAKENSADNQSEATPSVPKKKNVAKKKPPVINNPKAKRENSSPLDN